MVSPPNLPTYATNPPTFMSTTPQLQVHKGGEMNVAVGHRHRQRRRGRKSCCYPCGGVGRSALRGIGRCLFVSCYPVMQCFGLDERRHRHHNHRHFRQFH